MLVTPSTTESMLPKESSSQTVLVTGGSGFVGGAVCAQLQSRGYRVVNLDRQKPLHPFASETYPFDLASRQVQGLISLINPIAVIHLAAEHEVAKGELHPNVFYHNNVALSVKLLNECVEAGVKNFIFSSSSTVYGNGAYTPMSETHNLEPVSVYGKTKVMVEHMLEDYHRAFGINFVSLRYFNAAGATPDLQHGYRQKPASHLIPIICEVIKQKGTLKVFGSQYLTHDGTCMRDYTHVMDIADAHTLAIDYLLRGGHSSAINVGAGHSYSVLDVVKTFEEVTGLPVPYEFSNPRPGDASCTRADISRARTLLKWVPTKTLTDIVSDAWKWHTRPKKKPEAP